MQVFSKFLNLFLARKIISTDVRLHWLYVGQNTWILAVGNYSLLSLKSGKTDVVEKSRLFLWKMAEVIPVRVVSYLLIFFICTSNFFLNLGFTYSANFEERNWKWLRSNSWHGTWQTTSFIKEQPKSLYLRFCLSIFFRARPNLWEERPTFNRKTF